MRDNSTASPRAYVLSFVFVVTVVSAYMVYHTASSRRETLAYWEYQLSDAASYQVNMISSWLGERRGDATVLSALMVRMGAFETSDSDRRAGASRARDALNDRLDVFARAYGYAGVYVLDTESRVIARSSGAALPEPEASSVARTALSGREFTVEVIGDVPLSSFVAFAIPAYRNDPATPGAEPVAGAVELVMDPNRSLFALLISAAPVKKTEESLLARFVGDQLVIFSPLRHVVAGTPVRRFSIRQSRLPARAAVAGEERFGEFLDYRGEPVLATTRRIPETGWGLVRKIDRAEILADFYHDTSLEWVAAGLLVIAVGGLFLGQWRKERAALLKEEVKRQQEFRALVENAPDLIARLDRERRFVYVNPAVERATATPARAFVGKPLHQTVIPRNLADYVDESVSEVFATGEPRVLEFDYSTPLGARHYQARVVPELAADGSVRQVIGIARDITARRDAEETLRRVNRALRTLSECNHAVAHAETEPALLDHICRTIVEVGGYRAAWVGAALCANAFPTLQALAQAGLTEEQMQVAFQAGRVQLIADQVCRDELSVLADPGSDPLWQAEARELGYASRIALPLRAGGGPFGVLAIYSREPSAFDADEVRLLEDLAENLAYGLTSLRTRRERAVAEDALMRAEEKYRSIFENAVEGIFQASPDGKITAANPALARLLGYDSPGEMMRDPAGVELASYLAVDKLRELSELLQATGSAQGLEFELTVEGGASIWVRANVRRVLDAHGELICYEGSVEDVTSRRQLEEELRQSQKMDAVGRLAGGVADDFNNILTAIIGYSQLLLVRLDPSDPLRPEAQEIQKAGVRAAALTSQLLAFSRKQVMQPKSLDLNSVVADMERMLKRVIGEDVELELSLAPGLRRIKADRGQLEQLFSTWR